MRLKWEVVILKPCSLLQFIQNDIGREMDGPKISAYSDYTHSQKKLRILLLRFNLLHSENRQ